MLQEKAAGVPNSFKMVVFVSTDWLTDWQTDRWTDRQGNQSTPCCTCTHTHMG